MKLTKTAASSNLLHLGTLAIITIAGFGCSSSNANGNRVPVTFSGGHDIGQGDFGRPVALIAAGLGVEPDVFREAFSGVTPARDRGPSGEEARKNKAALMKVLAPHGVTNERIDEVSDYYRFRPQNGELWPIKEAQAYAIVIDGRIQEIVVTEPGSGYCSVPTATVRGIDSASLKVTLAFGKDLKKNGAISHIEVQPRSKGK